MNKIDQLRALQTCERDLICTLLDDNALTDTTDLSVNDFTLRECGLIYGKIRASVADQKSFGLSELLDSIANKGLDVEMMQANAILTALNMPSALQRNAKTIKTYGANTGLIKSLGEQIEVLSSTGNHDAVISNLSAIIEQSESNAENDDVFLSSVDAAQEYLDVMSKIHYGEVEAGFCVGLPELDDILGGGIKRGQLITIAGRPSLGKTGVSLNFAVELAREKKVLFYSLEMARQFIMQRVTAIQGNCNMGFLANTYTQRGGSFEEDQWANTTVAIDKIGKLDLTLSKRNKASAIDISNDIARLKRNGGVDVVFIDQLSKIQHNRENKYSNESYTIGATVNELQLLAIRHDVAIVLMAQINRDGDDKPTLRSLKDTGAIEESSDVVILLHRPTPSGTNRSELSEHQKKRRVLLVEKNRNGAVGAVECIFDGATQRLSASSIEFLAGCESESRTFTPP